MVCVLRVVWPVSICVLIKSGVFIRAKRVSNSHEVVAYIGLHTKKSVRVCTLKLGFRVHHLILLDFRLL